MWDDVIIGKGDKGNSAITVAGYNGPLSISSNRVSYWIDECYLRIGMTIFKDTKEGESLAFMLSSGTSDAVITEYLEDLALSHIDKAVLRRKIDEEMKRVYRAGGEDRAEKIRDALGIL